MKEQILKEVKITKKLKRIGFLYKKQKCLKGFINDLDLIIIENSKKKSDKSPDYFIYTTDQ